MSSAGDGMGCFRFIAVEGWMDCRDAHRDGRPGVEFSWDGDDGGDRVGGRGWAVVEADGSLRGHIDFHLGDDSAVRAVRAGEDPRFGRKEGARPPARRR